ncbi:MAG TPA: GTP cyclohydrolase FolE2 [Chloroflexota bacterium]|nr:GTP cyclohydrolase FolE2 [Chloroflexota bacterium]HUM69193.1 GTP cyclohydrolase FolE2 [Chloroflexota bacterium]
MNKTMKNNGHTPALSKAEVSVLNGHGFHKNGQNGLNGLTIVPEVDEVAADQRRVKDLQKVYDTEFKPTPAYKATMPDMQNTSENRGTAVTIQHVGIHNFKVPMRVITRDGGSQQVHCSITGTVSLDAYKKGINMSRIIRTFYEYDESELTPQTLQNVVASYLDNLESSSARIAIAFDYPLLQESLRSGLAGYQYYPVVLETIVTPDHGLRQFIHLDFVYSSACPCSYELSVHANLTRGVAAVPHSQRSVAKISVEYNDGFWIEDLVDIAREALQTETQVMVKREDEQAFAELNAANLKFVEDAVRLLYEGLDDDGRIADFRIFASHKESLHSHDAISVLVKGVPGGFDAYLEPFTYRSVPT